MTCECRWQTTRASLLKYDGFLRVDVNREKTKSGASGDNDNKSKLWRDEIEGESWCDDVEGSSDIGQKFNRTTSVKNDGPLMRLKR